MPLVWALRLPQAMNALSQNLRTAIGIHRFQGSVLVLGRFCRAINHHGAGKKHIVRAHIACEFANVRRAVDVRPIIFPVFMTGCRVDGGKVENIEWTVTTQESWNRLPNIEIHVPDLIDRKARRRDINAIYAIIALRFRNAL